ncbi:mechanosensitive ion channel domain-containing protein [Komagataeibacter sucrofermentans]|uniref:mechanosensitive ion channel domain-containing protein n=1 Tax=Komagataeibacter sucrofermentans TaxID=1053551 RepID=UPI001ABF5A82|nr:mechanosensitive ion channel domain-containing protein [Komagataeibacter sucrofermentans]GBQ43529.1 mechanosensitive ion channel MscS [Komagataeibacter sucrofermentans DSM 15973]
MSAHFTTRAHPVSRQSRRGGILTVLAAFLLALLPCIPHAHAADPGTAAAQATGQTITAQQAQQVLAVMNDPQKREEFTHTLDAIAKGLPAPTTPAAAPAPAPAPAKKAAAKSDVEVEPGSISSETMNELSHIRDIALQQGQNFMALFADLAFVGRWVHSILSNTDSRQILLDAMGRAGIIFILALVAERGLSIVLRKPLAGVTARAVATEQRLNQRLAREDAADADQPSPPPATAADAQAEQQTEQTREQDDRKQHETLRIITRIPYSLLHFLIKLLPVVLFFGLGYGASALFATTHQAAMVTITLTNAYVIARVIYLLLETVFVPHSPTIRLCSASDATARMVTRWWNFLVAAPSIVVCLSTLGGVFHMPARGTEAIIRAVVLIEHMLIAVFIWRIRHHVGAALQPSGRLREKPFWMFVGKMVRFWWIPAMFFDFALWLVWATQIQGGYAWILRTLSLTIVVILGARLLSVLAFSLQNKIFHVPEATEKRYPGLQARVDYYYPMARRTLSVLLVFFTVVLLLQSWGLPAIRFFVHGSLGTKIVGAMLTIMIAYTIAIVVWEVANATLQNQITRFETSDQASRATRLRTVLPIIRTVLLTFIIIIVTVTTLSQIGINVAPLLTGAGIMGAAIAFGSQSLVKDFITGFFMLVENAMQVGDWVTAGAVSGTVEHLSIRTLRLRAVNGDLHIIPFSSVTSIANTSRDYNLVVVSFMLDLSEDPHRVAAILQDELAILRKDHVYGPLIKSDFSFLGLEQADGNGSKFLGSIRTSPGSKWKVYREYYSRLSARMVKEKVKFPIPTSMNLLTNGPSGTLQMNMEENFPRAALDKPAQPEGIGSATDAPRVEGPSAEGHGADAAPKGNDAPHG